MSSEDVVISCRNVGKAFQLYIKRNDRLKQTVFGFWRRYYKQRWVLHDITFEVRRGERIGIIGRNGAGKTTLLQLICGITKPTHGSIEVKGRLAPILALGAGFDAELSGYENALIGGAILGLKRSELDARLQSIRQFADIGEYFDQPLKLYSSGMTARLAFAICAHVDADILIIDEALSVGDHEFQAKCEAFMEDFARTGTILLVTHSLGYLEQICDRAIWIEGGYIRKSGEPKSVIADYIQVLSGTGAPGGESGRELKLVNS